MSTNQHETINGHVTRGVEILRSLDITDNVGLDSVLQHHELIVIKPDGSAYLDPVRRERCDGEFAIRTADCPPERINIDRYRLWCSEERA